MKAIHTPPLLAAQLPLTLILWWPVIGRWF